MSRRPGTPGRPGQPAGRCCFCGDTRVRRVYADLYHPRKPDHGPFEFYECESCGSGLTLPPPARELIGRLYDSFASGLPAELRTARGKDGQRAWYLQCLRRATGRLPPRGRAAFSWMDVGAGGGELASLVAREYPDSVGLAVDLHERPEAISHFRNVRWQKVDPGDDAFARRLGGPVDLVLSVSVLEHVVGPDVFLRNLVDLVKPGGVLYLACPDWGSPARRVMRTRWPFFLPGEHLNMPTARGMARALVRALAHAGRPGAPVFVHRVELPYTLRYTLRFFGLPGLARIPPADWTLPLPAGALEAGAGPAAFEPAGLHSAPA